MRLLLAAGIILLAALLPSAANAEDCLGNFRCEHERFHRGYKELFGKFSRCDCNNGYCRPSTFRAWEDTPSKMAVLVDGCWYPIPKEVIVRPEEMTTEMRRLLFGATVHVCAIDGTGADPLFLERQGDQNIAQFGPFCKPKVLECVAFGGGM